MFKNVPAPHPNSGALLGSPKHRSPNWPRDLHFTDPRKESHDPEDNDPYGERDFGSIELEGERYFWKIDYYDRTLRFGAEDPADTSETMRVLTLMHASEY